MKKSNVMGLLVIFLIGCSNNEIEKKEYKKNNVNIENSYSKDDLIGNWRFFHADLVKGRIRKFGGNEIIVKNNFVGDDSLIVSFERNTTLKINGERIGNWELKNDSLFLKGSKQFSDFPLYLDTKYEIQKGNFTKNWYFYATFYSSNGIKHHSVKYVARKLDK